MMQRRTFRRKSGSGSIRRWASTWSRSAAGRIFAGRRPRAVLIGKEELIHYALLNMSPQEDRIGRCCKVGKETIFGLLKALETLRESGFRRDR